MPFSQRRCMTHPVLPYPNEDIGVESLNLIETGTQVVRDVARTPLSAYVPIFGALDTRGGRKLRTETHTRTHSNYPSSFAIFNSQKLPSEINLSTYGDTELNVLCLHYGTAKESEGGAKIPPTSYTATACVIPHMQFLCIKYLFILCICTCRRDNQYS